MLTRTEVFNTVTLFFKEKGPKEIPWYFGVLLTQNKCDYRIRCFTIARKDYLQLELGVNKPLVTIEVTRDNQKLLSPLIARSTEDL